MPWRSTTPPSQLDHCTLSSCGGKGYRAPRAPTHMRTGMNITICKVAASRAHTEANHRFEQCGYYPHWVILLRAYTQATRTMGSQTVMPLEAHRSPSNALSYHTRQTTHARSARATRTRLRNVWSTPGAGKGTPYRDDLAAGVSGSRAECVLRLFGIGVTCSRKPKRQ